MKADSMGQVPTLSIQDFSMVYTTEEQVLPVLRNINLEIERGQVYGLVGESGSGKSTLGLAIMRYLPPEGHIQNGNIKFNGIDLLALEEDEMRNIWGREISFVPQDPFSSLNPSLRIGQQLAEIFLTHKGLSKEQAQSKAIEWLYRVHLAAPEQTARKYPHQLSGGQKQRVLVAMALSNSPKLLVLDEPTTSLDVTTGAVILDLLRDLIQGQDTSVLFITHNLGIVAGLTDRVGVLYAGELVEVAPTIKLYHQPLHPYTQGLLNSIPTLGMNKDKNTLVGIPGQIPSLSELSQGCVFAPRCSLAVDICHQEPPPIEYPDNSRSVHCHRWQDISSGKISLQKIEQSQTPHKPTQTDLVLSLSDLEVTYKVSRPGWEGALGFKQDFSAVDGVSLRVSRNRTLGIVGESGSGKSSLALGIMGLTDIMEGEITLLNYQLPKTVRSRDLQTLKKIQMVFQNPDEVFPPSLTVNEILSRPLINLLGMKKSETRQRVFELLEMVKLPQAYAQRLPRQLSGGEKQRVAIAQAFVANPELLIADEPVSALDVSIQANILNLLRDLQREHQTASLLISHDIAVVTYLADEIAVMYRGKIMQFSSSRQILNPPYHPYTEALLSAVPVASPEHQSKAVRLEEEVARPLETVSGCPFHTRCPRKLGNICEEQVPPWQTTPEGKRIFCHIPLEELETSQAKIFNNEISGGN